MSRSFTIKRFFTIPVHELYGYFIDPVLLERWCAPQGMNLKIANFDATVGGRYTFKHTDGPDTYVANGHFRKIIQNELLQMVDDEIIDPKGKVLGRKIACDVSFTGFGNGSEVMIKQSGFSDAVTTEECQTGWKQCLDNLQDLVKDSGLRQFHIEEDRSERNMKI